MNNTAQTQLIHFSDNKIVENFEKNEDNGKLIHLVKIIGDIPLELENDSYLSIFREYERNIHNIALYPCRFIPELPRWAIKRFSKKGDIILDPFIGSGTTFVESMLLGRKCLGIDYNPYARLISKVKSTLIDTKRIKSEQFRILNNLDKNKKDIPKPTFKGVDFWFNQGVINALSKLKRQISLINDSDLQDFFNVVFSMTVRKSSYIAPGQILTARRKDWRKIKQLTEKDTLVLFEQISEEYVSYFEEFHKSVDKTTWTKIMGIDAKKIDLSNEINKVDLIVTSPPYINAMDYIWANRLRLHWLDLVKNDEDRLNLYNYEIGTERISKKEYEQIGRVGIPEIDKKIEEIYYYNNSDTQSKLRSRVVFRYFIDMKRHFEEAIKVLKKNGRYCLVVGDNTIRKVFVPTSEFLILIAEKVGFKKEMQFNIILKNKSLNVQRNVDFANEIKYDRMIVLRKD